jgi:hypothetical protein
LTKLFISTLNEADKIDLVFNPRKLVYLEISEIEGRGNHQFLSLFTNLWHLKVKNHSNKLDFEKLIPQMQSLITLSL